MSQQASNSNSCASEWGKRTCSVIMMVLVIMLMRSSPVNAFKFDTGSSDWQVSWDNTLKYSNAFRLNSTNRKLVSGINGDDGDRNFKRGLISNRFEDLTELDINYQKRFGFRTSASAWIDTEYLGNNANNSSATFNGLGRHDQFDSATVQLSGMRAELLDAFVWGNGKMGKMPVSFRLGRHTLMWGESLFFAGNGIAAGMAPIDIVKALSVPGTQAKELFMPVAQFSGMVQITSKLSVSGFIPFEWRRSRMPAVGSYFSDADIIDAGGRRLLLGANPRWGYGAALFRTSDMGAGNYGLGNETQQFGQLDFGQGGLNVRYRSDKLGTEFGLYWYRYHEKSPYWLYLYPGKGVNLAKGKVGEYSLVFPRGIHMVGTSFSTVIGPVNVGGDLAMRINTPLISTAQTVDLGETANNSNHPLYAVGNTLHGTISATYLLPPGPKVGKYHLWQGGNILAEFAWQYLVNVTKNNRALDPTRNSHATGFRVLFEPAYYQIRPGLDLIVPIGLGYTPFGASPVDLKFNGNDGDAAGDVSIGVRFIYKNTWYTSLVYTNYFGGAGVQHLNDRDLISFYIRRTF